MTEPSHLHGEVVADPAAAGLWVANQIAGLLWGRPHRAVVIGCPTGRTPRTTYAALGELAAAQELDLSHLVVVMMDEYVSCGAQGYELIPADAPHSCQGFVTRELLPTVNAGLPPACQLPGSQVHFPDPARPEAHDDFIRDLGGVDLFLLAAGTTDGHVAFNPPGSPLDSRTRVVALADTTREDNLRTFPSLRTLDDVPSHGVTVGLGTIAEHSRGVVLLLLGSEKRAVRQRITDAHGFDASCPATMIWSCRNAAIIADAAAMEQP